MQFLQLMCHPQHGPCPCQLSPAESGKPSSCCYLSNLFLANRHTKAPWPVPAIRSRIWESYIQNPSVTPYLLRKTGKPTKCPVEILPMSHIHSGKTASGTTWVHMESSKGKSVGSCAWIDRGFLTSIRISKVTTWTFIGSRDTRTDTRKCQTWSKTMQNMAKLWHYSLSDSDLENVENLQKKYCMLHLQWKLRGTPVAPPWGLCLGSSAPMSLDRPRMGRAMKEVWNPSAWRGSTHEISWNFIKAARKQSAMAAMEMAMPGKKCSSKMHCIWSCSDAGSMR